MSSCSAMTATDSVGSRWDSALRIVRNVALAILTNVWVLLVCKGVIGSASAFDTYLTVKYVGSLPTYELNPLGRWLMGLDTGPEAETQQIAAFVAAKFIGTIVVLLTIQGLAFWRMHLAGLVAIPMAAFQLSLVLHLLFGPG